MPANGKTVPEKEVKEFETHLENVLKKLDKSLETQEWIAGTKEISIADISCNAELSQCRMLKYDLSPYPKLAAWHKKVIAFNSVLTKAD